MKRDKQNRKQGGFDLNPFIVWHKYFFWQRIKLKKNLELNFFRAHFTFFFSLTRPIAQFIGMYFNYIKQVKFPIHASNELFTFFLKFSKRYFSLIEPFLDFAYLC